MINGYNGAVPDFTTDCLPTILLTRVHRRVRHVIGEIFLSPHCWNARTLCAKVTLSRTYALRTKLIDCPNSTIIDVMQMHIVRFPSRFRPRVYLVVEFWAGTQLFSIHNWFLNGFTKLVVIAFQQTLFD